MPTLPYVPTQVRADALGDAEIAMIGGTWSYVHRIYTTNDLPEAQADFADDPATLKQVTDIVSASLPGYDGVYVAVHYLYTNVSSRPGPEYRYSASAPRMAVAAYSMYELIDIQSTDRSN